MTKAHQITTITIPRLSSEAHLTAIGLEWLKANACRVEGVHALDEDEWEVSVYAPWANSGCFRLIYATEWAQDRGYEAVRFSPDGDVIEELRELG